MGDEDLRVAVWVVLHISADLKTEGKPGGVRVIFLVVWRIYILWYIHLIKHVTSNHLSGQGLPGFVHLFGPDAQLFV